MEYRLWEDQIYKPIKQHKASIPTTATMVLFMCPTWANSLPPTATGKQTESNSAFSVAAQLFYWRMKPKI